MPNPTASKPATVYLDPAHALATGLRCYIGMTEGSGAAVDAVSGAIPHFHEGFTGLGNGDAPVWVANQFAGGPVLRFQAGTPTITYRGRGLMTSWATGPKTIFGVIRHFNPAEWGSDVQPLVYIMGPSPDQYFTSVYFSAKTGGIGRASSSTGLNTTISANLGAMQLLPNRWYAFAVVLDDSTTPDTRQFFLYDYTAQVLHSHNGQGGLTDPSAAGTGTTTNSAAHFALNNGASTSVSQFIGDMACAGFAEAAWDASDFQSFYQDPWGVVRGAPAVSPGALSWGTETCTLTSSSGLNGGTAVYTFYKNDGTTQDVTLNWNSSTAQTLTAVEAVYGAGNVWVSGGGNLNTNAHTLTIPQGQPPPILKTNSLTGGASPNVTITAVYNYPRLWHYDNTQVVITCPKPVGTGTGGTGSPTYQWHRSHIRNFTPSGATALSGKTSPVLIDTDAIDPNIKYVYRCVVTDGSSTLTADYVPATRAPYPTMRVGIIGTSLSNFSPSATHTKFLGRSNAHSGVINRGKGGSSWTSWWRTDYSFGGASAQYGFKMTNGTSSGGTFTVSGSIGGTYANGYTDGTAFGPTAAIAHNASSTDIAAAIQAAAEIALPGATCTGTALSGGMATVTFGGAADRKFVVLTVDDSLVTGADMIAGNLNHPIVQCYIITVGEPAGTTNNAFNLARQYFAAAGCNIVSIEMMANDSGLSLANFQTYVSAAVSTLVADGYKVVLQQGTNFYAWPTNTLTVDSDELQRQYCEWLETQENGTTVFAGSRSAFIFLGTHLDTTTEANGSAIALASIIHPSVYQYPMTIAQWAEGIEKANGITSSAGGGSGGGRMGLGL